MGWGRKVVAGESRQWDERRGRRGTSDLLCVYPGLSLPFLSQPWLWKGKPVLYRMKLTGSQFILLPLWSNYFLVSTQVFKGHVKQKGVKCLTGPDLWVWLRRHWEISCSLRAPVFLGVTVNKPTKGIFGSPEEVLGGWRWELGLGCACSSLGLKNPSPHPPTRLNNWVTFGNSMKLFYFKCNSANSLGSIWNSTVFLWNVNM